MKAPTTADAVREVIARVPGPQAPARPTTPVRACEALVAPLLTALGHQFSRSNHTGTVLHVQLPSTEARAAVVVVAPGRLYRYRTDDDRLRASATRDTASVVLGTDGYRWTVGTVSPETDRVMRLFDIDCTPLWQARHSRPPSGYVKSAQSRARLQTVVEFLSPGALRRWHRTGVDDRQQLHTA